MLSTLRKRMKIFIWIAAGSFIAYILLQWGMDIAGRRHASPIERGILAEVNGEPISRSDYRAEIERLSKTEAQRLGKTELSEEIMEVIYDRAFDALVVRKLLDQEVKQRKIAVTDEEILNVVRYSPPQEFLQAEEFQTEGEFDFEKYHQFIQDPKSFRFLINYELRIRENLPVQKLQLLVLSPAKVPDWRVREEYLKRNEAVRVEYISIQPDPAQPVEVSEKEIHEYYTSHEEDLLEPEKATISYVFFEKKASEEDAQLVAERIAQVYDEAMEDVDFAELAAYYSEDPGSASEGGDLGWFTEGTMVKEFDDVVFSLKKGEISKPFRTLYGWHIVKVYGRKKDEVKASHILLRIGPSVQTLENIRNKMSEFIEDIRSVGFEEAALKHTMEVQSTEEFSLGSEYIPGFGFSKEIHEFIVENGVGEVSYPITRGNRYHVFKIADKKSRVLPDLDKVSSEIEKRVRTEKQKMYALERASEIYEDIIDGASLRAAAESHGLKVEKPTAFTRVSNIQGILPQSEFFGAAFELGDGEVSTPVETEQGYFIVKVLKKVPVDEQEFEETRESLRLELLQEQQQQLYSTWIQNLRARAKIKDHRRKLL